MSYDHEVLAAGLGAALVLTGSVAAILLQKLLFARYRRRVRNAQEQKDPLA